MDTGEKFVEAFAFDSRKEFGMKLLTEKQRQAEVRKINAAKLADIVLVDEDLNPKMTIAKGEMKWHSST